MAERKSYTPDEFVQLIHDFGWEKDMGLALHFNNYNFDFMISDASVKIKNNKYFLSLHDGIDGKLVNVELLDVTEDNENVEQLKNGKNHPDSFLAAVISHDGNEFFLTAYNDEVDKETNEKDLTDAVIKDFIEYTGIVYKHQLLKVFNEAEEIVNKKYGNNANVVNTQTSNTNQNKKPIMPTMPYKPFGDGKIVTDENGHTYHT